MRCFARNTAAIALALLFAGLLPARIARPQALAVDVALVLAVDVSYSVDSTEFRLQMDGIGLAFANPQVHRAILQGINGRIAVAVLQWSSETSQIVGISWTVVDSPKSALALSARMYREPRRAAEGATATGAAMRFAGAMLLSAPFVTHRRIVDISSDGRSNRGPSPRSVRAALAARNITVNGLAIKNEWPTLDIYFRQNIVGGPYHFVISANDYAAYTNAIYRKLLKEITGPGIS